jgi:hypothetical protein
LRRRGEADRGEGDSDREEREERWQIHRQPTRMKPRGEWESVQKVTS